MPRALAAALAALSLFACSSPAPTTAPACGVDFEGTYNVTLIQDGGDCPNATAFTHWTFAHSENVNHPAGVFDAPFAPSTGIIDEQCKATFPIATANDASAGACGLLVGAVEITFATDGSRSFVGSVNRAECPNDVKCAAHFNAVGQIAK